MNKDIDARICGALDRIATARRDGTADNSSRAWTTDIKAQLCEIGHAFNNYVCAASCGAADEGEWLFDLVWYKGERDEMWDLPLVAECEWSLHIEDITRDFGKLLVAKASIKLFIYQQYTMSDLTEVTSVLMRLHKAFQRQTPGELYLLAGYVCDDHCFEYSRIVA